MNMFGGSTVATLDRIRYGVVSNYGLSLYRNLLGVYIYWDQANALAVAEITNSALKVSFARRIIFVDFVLLPGRKTQVIRKVKSGYVTTSIVRNRMVYQEFFLPIVKGELG